MVAGLLWGVYCGVFTVGCLLWGSYCGTVAVGQLLWGVYHVALAATANGQP